MSPSPAIADTTTATTTPTPDTDTLMISEPELKPSFLCDVCNPQTVTPNHLRHETQSPNPEAIKHGALNFQLPAIYPVPYTDQSSRWAKKLRRDIPRDHRPGATQAFLFFVCFF